MTSVMKMSVNSIHFTRAT